jgi:hypothetical protein
MMKENVEAKKDRRSIYFSAKNVKGTFSHEQRYIIGVAHFLNCKSTN